MESINLFPQHALFSKFEIKMKGSSILKFRKKGRSNISFTGFPGVKKNPPFNYSNQNLSIEQKKISNNI